MDMFEYNEIAIIIVTVIGGITLYLLISGTIKHFSKRLADAVTNSELNKVLIEHNIVHKEFNERYVDFLKDHEKKHERIQFVFDKLESNQQKLRDTLPIDYVRSDIHEKDIQRIEAKLDLIDNKLDKLIMKEV